MKRHVDKLVMYHRQVLTAVLLVGIIALFVLLVSLQVPAMIVEALGPERSYVAIFLVGALGGVSTFTTATYFGVVASFADAGLNVYWLSVAGGVGSAIGDALFFFFGRNSRAVLNARTEKIIYSVRDRLESVHKAFIPVFVYVYAAFTPLPNEFMTIPVGLSGMRFRYIVIPLVLGNITVTFLAVTFLPKFFALF